MNRIKTKVHDYIDLKCDLQRAVNAYNRAVSTGDAQSAWAYKQVINKVQKLINKACQ